MKKRFTQEQIIDAIKSYEAGCTTEDICRELGVARGTFYNWRSKYAGLGVEAAKRLKSLELENTRLKKLLSERSKESKALKAVLSKKW